ncbi:hypothetical protein ANANG_G00118610 [Anguilla anguilla]|uniref:Uncharacterized protein n=1 Tax=Anguilla anguilla TaxID=7936 RepID=A0A9D3MD29_ANGAN|nr:hypothetical protein ANANG_G00118610 [Anguilla anguilla]
MILLPRGLTPVRISRTQTYSGARPPRSSEKRRPPTGGLPPVDLAAFDPRAPGECRARVPALRAPGRQVRHRLSQRGGGRESFCPGCSISQQHTVGQRDEGQAVLRNHGKQPDAPQSPPRTGQKPAAEE